MQRANTGNTRHTYTDTHKDNSFIHCHFWVLRKRLFTWQKKTLQKNQLLLGGSWSSSAPSKAPISSCFCNSTWLLLALGSLHKPCGRAHVTPSRRALKSSCVFIQKDKRPTKPWVRAELIGRPPAVHATRWFCLFLSFDLLFLGRRLTNRTINTWVELEITVWFLFCFFYIKVVFFVKISQRQATCEGWVQKNNLWTPYSKHSVVVMTCDLQTADGPGRVWAAFKRPH